MEFIDPTPTRLSATVTRLTRSVPEIVRCQCAVCGAHSNAVLSRRITGSCPNCGSLDLSPVDGAGPLGGPLAA